MSYEMYYSMDNIAECRSSRMKMPLCLVMPEIWSPLLGIQTADCFGNLNSLSGQLPRDKREADISIADGLAEGSHQTCT